MNRTQFNELTRYLEKEHSELFKKFPNNTSLINGDFVLFQPAKVTDEEYDEMLKIISKWKEDNNAMG